MYFTYGRVGLWLMGFSGIVSGISAVISVLLQSALEKSTVTSTKTDARIEFQDRPLAEALGVDLHHIEC